MRCCVCGLVCCCCCLYLKFWESKKIFLNLRGAIFQKLNIWEESSMFWHFLWKVSKMWIYEFQAYELASLYIMCVTDWVLNYMVCLCCVCVCVVDFFVVSMWSFESIKRFFLDFFGWGEIEFVGVVVVRAWFDIFFGK